MKPGHKYWERSLFFQMHKSQLKITRHVKKQENMNKLEEQNKFPETNTKETKIYKLP